ncbi:NADPH-dependent 1-acyldihydroxyacetone phosphate reductase-like [Dendrobium catenatum]|uniref:NADPH-dependent 1-acyldihydroxyacetone phosphate reductase-like n=1 Tax=Dendrobium catenatum TaxID=906689 RepID=UPI0009F2CE90|nr:NADPH-dependent 1-acyldihydroxyacetone phosphate reductase-like [Dendrobium catenatum]
MAEPEKQVVLITGCSEGGIGYAFAREFASNGCLVTVTARSLSSMRSSEGDQRFFLLELDVLFDECIQKAVEGTLAGFGWNHILINNTGIHNVAPLAVVPMSTVEHVMSTNVYDLQRYGLNPGSLGGFIGICEVLLRRVSERAIFCLEGGGRDGYLHSEQAPDVTSNQMSSKDEAKKLL